MLEWCKIKKGIIMRKLILSVYDIIHSSTTTDLTTLMNVPKVDKEKILSDEYDFMHDPLFVDLMYKKIINFDKKLHNKKIMSNFFKNNKMRWGINFSLLALSTICLNFSGGEHIAGFGMILMFLNTLNFLTFILNSYSNIGMISGSGKDQIISKIKLTHEDYILLSENYNKKTIKNLLEIMERDDSFARYSFDEVVALQEEKNGTESLFQDIDNLPPEFVKKLKRDDYAESLYIDKKD